MNNYKQATNQIMKYLEEKHYSHTLLSVNRVCFTKLESYLSAENKSYSPTEAENWFKSIKESLSTQQQSFYRMSLLRLKDIYEDGEIHSNHDTKHLKSYTVLNDGLKNELDEFLEALNGKLSPKTIRGYKHCCARFLIFFQKKGISRISEITYTLIVQFYNEDIHYGRWGKNQLNGKVPAMLEFFFEQGRLSYGFTRIFHYLSLGKGCYWNDVCLSDHGKIQSIMAMEENISIAQLIRYKEISNGVHVDNGYSKEVLSVNNRAADLLILFLDMNDYKYNPSVAMIWLDSCSQWFCAEVSSIRRALCLIAQYHNSSKINVESVFRV